MNPDIIYSVEQTQYKISNLIFGILFIGLIFLALYILWRWCGDDNQKKSNASDKERLTMAPVFAHEIEPGIVVLQSEDGEYFKILKEYDMKNANNRYGSVSCTRPEVAQPNQLQQTFDASSILTPSMSSDLCQAGFPSAPPEMHVVELERQSLTTRNTTAGARFDKPPPYGSR